MTFEEWLDEPQTVMTKRERFERCLKSVQDEAYKEILREWLKLAWLSGQTAIIKELVT